MANKEEFLNDIAQKLGRERVATVHKPIWPPNSGEQLYLEYSSEELVARFVESLQSLGGTVILVPHRDQLKQALNEWLNQINVTRIISWQHPSPNGIALQQALAVLSEADYDVTFWDENRNANELLTAAEKAEVGLTVAEYGLAETGTIVLYNKGNQGRLTSLLPPVSASVLSASSILPRLTQLLPKIGQRVEEYSCINLITGPSRSADIEMDLSIGVHGPGSQVVFLIERDI